MIETLTSAGGLLGIIAAIVAAVAGIFFAKGRTDERERQAKRDAEIRAAEAAETIKAHEVRNDVQNANSGLSDDAIRDRLRNEYPRD